MALVKKYGKLIALIFVAFYLLTQPEGAARIIHTAASGLQAAATSLARFVNTLA